MEPLRLFARPPESEQDDGDANIRRVKIVCNTLSGENFFSTAEEHLTLEQLNDAKNAPVQCVTAHVQKLGAAFQTTLETVAFQRWLAAVAIEQDGGAVHNLHRNIESKDEMGRLHEAYREHDRTPCYFEHLKATGRLLFVEKLVDVHPRIDDSYNGFIERIVNPGVPFEERISTHLSAELRLFDYRGELIDPRIRLVVELNSEFVRYAAQTDSDPDSGAPNPEEQAAQQPGYLQDYRFENTFDPRRKTFEVDVDTTTGEITGCGMWYEGEEDLVYQTWSGEDQMDLRAGGKQVPARRLIGLWVGLCSRRCDSFANTFRQRVTTNSDHRQYFRFADPSRAETAFRALQIAAANAVARRDAVVAEALEVSGLTEKTYKIALAASSVEPHFARNEDPNTYRPAVFRLGLDGGCSSFGLEAEHTLSALVPYVTSQEYRELHELEEDSPLTYHVYAGVGTSETPAQFGNRWFY